MSEITLLNVIENLKIAYRLTSYQSKKCDEFFSVIHAGDFVYPGHLKSKLCIDIKTAYFFMDDLKNRGFVKKIYEVYCMDCNRSKGVFLESLTDFDEKSTCDFCNKPLTVSDDIIVLYKVLHI